LGSLWALIPAFVGACGFAIRTFFEDCILMEELSGYREYARSVPFRLLPGIW
jgi:protein-S-isoprenylcysteine O-methyltransferase Ste14